MSTNDLQASSDLLFCPFCGSGAVSMVYEGYDSNGMHFASLQCGDCGAVGPGGVGTSKAAAIADATAEWNRRAERTWHDFSDELPPVGVSVLCRGKNGALYVGKPVTFKGNGTRKVWVPRGNQYRTPEKWMEVSE